MILRARGLDFSRPRRYNYKGKSTKVRARKQEDFSNDEQSLKSKEVNHESKSGAHLSDCLIALMAAVMAGCGGLSAPGGGNCSQGVCIKVQIAEPVRFNEPTAVTVTITTEQDISKLGVFLSFTDPDIVIIDGPQDWFVDTKANQSISFTRLIRFPEEGYFNVIAGAVKPTLGPVKDSVSVHITRAGGTVNPPPERKPGTPAPAERADTPGPRLRVTYTVSGD